MVDEVVDRIVIGSRYLAGAPFGRIIESAVDVRFPIHQERVSDRGGQERQK
jgi:hypothetical protein